VDEIVTRPSWETLITVLRVMCEISMTPGPEISANLLHFSSEVLAKITLKKKITVVIINLTGNKIKYLLLQCHQLQKRYWLNKMNSKNRNSDSL
jgi:hypothetical protein